MMQIIRLTESDLHNIIKESVRTILMEMDGIGGGGASNIAGSLQGGGTNPEAGEFFGVPVGAVQRRKGYSPKGDKVSKGMTQVDQSKALDRTGGDNHSLSINHVDESIGKF